MPSCPRMVARVARDYERGATVPRYGSSSRSAPARCARRRGPGSYLSGVPGGGNDQQSLHFSFDRPTPKASTDFRLTLLGLTKAGEKMFIPVQFEKRYQVILEGN